MGVVRKGVDQGIDQGIYPEKESKLLEFKEKLTDWDKIVKTCVAFANGGGGELVIGVKDGTRDVVGVSQKEEEAFYESIPNKIFDSISPLLVPDLFEKNFGDKNVCVIRIHSGSRKPYFFKKEGLSKGVYLRVGPHTRRVPEEDIAELVASSRGLSYDGEVMDLPVDTILKNSTVRELYGKRLSIGLLERAGLVGKTPSGKMGVTRAAALAFLDLPQDYVPEAVVICTLFKGNEGRDIIFTRELTGPIYLLAEEGVRLVLSWIEKDFRLKGVAMKGVLPVPAVAVREALVNALIHRKYSIAGAVKVAVFEGRMEIFSPGQFPGTILPDNLGDGTTVLRNPLLAKFARRLGLIEKLGSGIKMIFEECKKAKIRKPEFQENGDFVKVIFYFEREVQLEGDLEEVIRNELKSRDILRVEDVLAMAKVSRNTVTNVFRTLMKKGLVERHGGGRGVFYKLKK